MPVCESARITEAGSSVPAKIDQAGPVAESQLNAQVAASSTTVRKEAAMITVVIPTRNRPALVERAVRSALTQSFHGIEVVAVIDGTDPETSEGLHRVEDERLHIVQLGESVGGAEARNIGVRFAHGKWIAFLDDDDEWLPNKLAAQWEIAESLPGPYSLVASRFIERTENADRVLPSRLPDQGEAISEYLFVRRGWQSGEGFIQTSTWLVSRELMTRVPFTRGLRRCQDLDWLLHASALSELNVRVTPEVLAIFHHDDRHERVSRAADWRFLYTWAVANRAYFTARAFSFFVSTFCVPSAAKQRETISTFVFLLRSCLTNGRANGKCVLLFLICWWLPESRRRSLRRRYDGLKITAMRRLFDDGRHAVPGKAVS